MNKFKIIIVAISIVVLVIISIVLLRFIQGLLFTAAQDLQQAGEAIVETEPQERWVAPTMPEVYDIENGMDSVEAEDKAVSAQPTDFEDDDEESVPVEETADQLAGTTPDDDMGGRDDALPE